MIVIRRWYHNDCTLGRLTFGDFQCFTLELPWRDNQSGDYTEASCIVPGSYDAFRRISPSNGPCLELKDVPGRTHIQIHKGNFTSDIRGCILVGDSIRFINADTIPDVGNSVATLNKLLALVHGNTVVRLTDR